MLVGYMRVSSDGDRQTTALQRDALLLASVYDRYLSADKKPVTGTGLLISEPKSDDLVRESQNQPLGYYHESTSQAIGIKFAFTSRFLVD